MTTHGLKLIEHRMGNQSAWTIHDGARLVVSCRPVGVGGYIVRGRGVSLLDKAPHPTYGTLRGTGPAAPYLIHAKDAREARGIMRRLADPGRRSRHVAPMFRPGVDSVDFSNPESPPKIDGESRSGKTDGESEKSASC